MPEEEKSEEDLVQLPGWYLKLEKAAGKLSAGCIAAEILIYFGVKHIFKPEVIQVIQALLVPFGLICVVLSGYNGIDTINTMLEVLKKVKQREGNK